MILPILKGEVVVKMDKCWTLLWVLLGGLVSFSVIADRKLSDAEVAAMPGLKRFSSGPVLGHQSQFDIKQVRAGDYVLDEVLRLNGHNGEVHHVSGGSRSRKASISFYQPYQDAQLVQRMTLHFDKDHGFVHQVESSYKLDSAYLDIMPVYQKVIAGAISKYGAPLSMQQVRSIAGGGEGDVRLSAFLARAEISSDVRDRVQAFFEDKIVTRRTRFTATEDGHALLITGFNECYLWPGEKFHELLTLCAFRPNSGNMKGQGVDLTLYGFAARRHIENYRAPQDDGVSINL